MTTAPTQSVAGPDDGYLTLAQAARTLPRDITRWVIWRWTRHGLKGRNGEVIRLKHVRIGKRLHTKQSWIDQFLQDLADADIEHFQRHAQPTNRTKPEQLPASHWEADRALTEAGM